MRKFIPALMAGALVACSTPDGTPITQETPPTTTSQSNEAFLPQLMTSGGEVYGLVKREDGTYACDSRMTTPVELVVGGKMEFNNSKLEIRRENDGVIITIEGFNRAVALVVNEHHGVEVPESAKPAQISPGSVVSMKLPYRNIPEGKVNQLVMCGEKK